MFICHLGNVCYIWMVFDIYYYLYVRDYSI